VPGSLAELPRKNCWTIAEYGADAAPGGMQHLLSRAPRDADGVRDDLHSYAPGAVRRPGRSTTAVAELNLNQLN
jgi:hypothetical protein